MTKSEILNKCAKNDEERLILARFIDKLEKTVKKNIPSNTDFLTPAERVLAENVLKFYPEVRFEFFGAYESAERTVCIFVPDWAEDADREVLTIIETELYTDGALSHRDILGSLMGLGLVREKIGDIIISGDVCQVIALDSVADIIVSQWEKAGRYGVNPIKKQLEAIIAPEPEIKIIKDTVKTLRLDSVCAAGFSISRSRASELIEGGKVSLNHIICVKTDKIVCESDVLSCRGFGKCILRKIVGKSRKDRHIIEIDRYV